ncbi:MAG: helicase HerA-like domain-containing protein [Pseudomonadota bacterium]|nr:helicase HerA-like domain-containing protein [Pseudomonadota bacterium]
MSTDADSIFIGGGGPEADRPQTLRLRYANRHGLVAGATGTGKTVTLQILAQAFSDAGSPVFLADVKGDLTGLCQPGGPAQKAWPKLEERAARIGMGELAPAAVPAVFWDMFGEDGHPIRATVSEMGPLLLARLLELNDTQEGVLNVLFRLADDEGLLLIDLKDLQSLLVAAADRTQELSTRYGLVSKASIGAIQRRLLVLENEGAAGFFGEPALSLADMMTVEPDGRGRVNVLAARRLITSPRLYAAFLLWLLSELFEELPEVGDPDRPKFVFFFDEAHLLFDDAPKALLDKVEQVVRLIRSKGVGVWFVTQSPADVPDEVLGQLGSRIQHALRAYTPRDRKALKAAADSFRPNPEFEAMEVLTGLGIGEALVSTLQDKGAPSVVERTLIRPPASRLGPAEPMRLAAVRDASPVAGKYDEAVDRDSAFEILARRADAAAEAAERAEAEAEAEAAREKAEKAAARTARSTRVPQTRTSRGREPAGLGESLLKGVVDGLNSREGRRLVRGLLGSLFKGR